jgi:hypothetical protein
MSNHVSEDLKIHIREQAVDYALKIAVTGADITTVQADKVIQDAGAIADFMLNGKP